MHAYPDSPPNQVRFRYGPSTSYHFLQTPPLASDALVSRILFPVDGVRSLTSSDRVCQLRWANKKHRLIGGVMRRCFSWVLSNFQGDLIVPEYRVREGLYQWQP